MTKKLDHPSRCQHRDELHRRCRMPRIDTHAAFCYRHARMEQEVLDADRRGSELLSLSGQFMTATDINHVLGKLFNLLAENRIPTRDAAVLAYIGQLLLHTVNRVKWEVQTTHDFSAYEQILRRALPSAPSIAPKPHNNAHNENRALPQVPPSKLPTGAPS
jgi:hypothetical protein